MYRRRASRTRTAPLIAEMEAHAPRSRQLLADRALLLDEIAAALERIELLENVVADGWVRTVENPGVSAAYPKQANRSLRVGSSGSSRRNASRTNTGRRCSPYSR